MRTSGSQTYSKRTPQPSPELKSLDYATLKTLSEKLPALAVLFDKLAHGEHPDFLVIMNAIAEMVAFYTECDSNGDDLPEKLFLMSQKNCRFCD